MILSLKALTKTSKDKAPGYLDDIVALATVVGDRVLISKENWNTVKRKYSIVKERCGSCNQVK